MYGEPYCCDMNYMRLTHISAPLTLCSHVVIDPATLRNVFGSPQAAASSQVNSVAQAAAVTPINGTLVDLDYWDLADDFTQALSDYDKFDWTLTKVGLINAKYNNF